jgi:hypothetical protein
MRENLSGKLGAVFDLEVSGHSFYGSHVVRHVCEMHTKRALYGYSVATAEYWSVRDDHMIAVNCLESFNDFQQVFRCRERNFGRMIHELQFVCFTETVGTGCAEIGYRLEAE